MLALPILALCFGANAAEPSDSDSESAEPAEPPSAESAEEPAADAPDGAEDPVVETPDAPDPEAEDTPAETTEGPEEAPAEKEPSPPESKAGIDPDCENTYDDQEIKGVSAQAQDAFANLDEDGFVSARDELLMGIGCVVEPLTSSAVAGYFKVRALDAHLRRAPDDLRANVVAMAEIDPVPPPTSVTPRGHPVRNAWETARAAGPTSTDPLPVPSGGRIRVDGRDTLDLPVERPTVVQFVNTDGSLAWTEVLEVGSLRPEYAEASEDYRQKYENAIIVSAPRKPVELPVLAGIFGAGAIGTYAATFATRKRFFDAEDPADLRTLRNSNNALVITSTGLGAVALGLGTYTVLTW